MDENLSSYLRAVRPQRFQLLGERLLDLTVGHHTLLAAAGNKFVAGDAEPEFLDLAQGIAICSRSYQEAAQDGDLTLFIRRLEHRLALRKALVRMRVLPLQSVSVPAMIETFAEYLLANSHCPEITPRVEGEGSRQLGSPLLQLIKVTLMAKLGQSHSQAMDYLWGEALHDVAAYWEIEGVSKITSEEDRAIHAEHLEVLQSMAAQLEELERLYCQPQGS